MKHSTLLILSLAAALVLLTGCGGEKAIANVDGESITAEEFNQYLATKRNVRVIVQGQVVDVPVSESLGFQALQELATQKVVLSLAKEANFAPTEADIEKEIDFKNGVNPRFLTDLKNSGMSLGQIRREVAYSIAEERLLTRGIKVRMDEVDQMIKDKPDQFTEPATVDAYQIFVMTQARKALVDKEIKAGQAFKAVSAKYNQSQSGSKIRLQTNKVVDPVKSVIQNAKVGSTTEWITVNGGFNRFYIESKTEAKPIEMTPEKKEYLRRQIAMSRGRQANDLAKQVAEKLRKADINISDDEEVLKTMWKRFEERLEKSADEKKAAQ